MSSPRAAIVVNAQGKLLLALGCVDAFNLATPGRQLTVALQVLEK